MLKILFDHCTPRPLKREFGPKIQVTEAQTVKLAQIRNSQLELRAHQLGYGALITVDTDFGNPHHFPEYHIPVVLLRAFPAVVSATLSILIPEVEEALLGRISPGLYVWDNYEGTILSARSLRENSDLRKELNPKLAND